MLLTIEDFTTAAQMAGSYMLTLTTLEKGKLNHNLLVNQFPNGDCLRSHAECEKLIIEHLKKRTVEAEGFSAEGDVLDNK